MKANVGSVVEESFMNRKWVVTFATVVTSVALAGCNDGSGPAESFDNGTFTVGTDIREGDYVTEGTTDNKCRIEISPPEGSVSGASVDKGESKNIELSSGDEVITVGCEEFVRQ
jgi:hypothetical protein